MKRTLAFILGLLLLLSLTACSGDGIVGKWTGEEDGHTGVLVFNKDGTGSIGIDGIDIDTKWSVAEGKYLTVTMEVSGTEHKAFDGAEFTVEDDTLTIVNDGEEAVFKRG